MARRRTSTRAAGDRGGVRLPFSYPPVAAIVFSPLALVPLPVAVTALTLATVAATAVVLRMFLRRLRGQPAGSPWAVGWLLPAALFFEPVRNTLGYGQVNVVLMALVSADCLTRDGALAARRLHRAGRGGEAHARGRSCCISCCGGTTGRTGGGRPVVRRQHRGRLPAAGRDSARYWTSAVFQGGRPGNPAYAANQCIVGVLARAGWTRYPTRRPLWLALAAAGGRGQPGHVAGARAAPGRLALSLNAFAALLISPVSWSHHWVWGEAGC